VIAALLVLTPLGLVAAWVFVRSSPSRGDGRAVRRFNVLSLIVALGLAAAWSARTYVAMAATPDAPWWPVIAALGALFIVPLALAVAGVLRLVLFRPRAGEARR
jgi:hypothetical protein